MTRHEHDPELTTDNPDDDTPKKRGSWLPFILAGAAVAVVLGVGFASRAAHSREISKETRRRAIPSVEIVEPQTSRDGAPLVLPARLEAFLHAPIFGRVSGYLKSWRVDIGTEVKEGEVLGIVATPDLDQQIMQARAEVGTARAEAALARSTYERWKDLVGTDAVSRQEVDEKQGDYRAKRARVRAARAAVERLEALQGYTRLVAPFDGVVTARNTDVGALVVEGENQGPPLFEIADTSRLRGYVQIPQTYAPQIKNGDTVEVRVPEYPGETFEAKVELTANAVRPDSGTTPAQLWIDNQDGRLMPGSYGKVAFSLPPTSGGLVVPSSALVFDAEGLRVATVEDDQTVKFRPVRVGRDFGKTIEVMEGLDAGARVVKSPSDGLFDGTRVEISNPKKKKKKDESEKKQSPKVPNELPRTIRAREPQ